MSAEILRPAEAELRFGEWGPAYLSQDVHAAFGTVVLRPGDAFGNHLHEHHTESFIAVDGEAEVWIDRTHRLTLCVGELLHAGPGEEHFLRNTSDAVFRAIFIKTPWVDGDKIERPWEPGADQ